MASITIQQISPQTIQEISQLQSSIIIDNLTQSGGIISIGSISQTVPFNASWDNLINKPAYLDYIVDLDSSAQGQIDLKANTSDVTSALALKADKTYVDTQDALKADTSYVNTQLGLKANSSDVTTSLSTKANTTYVDAQVSALQTQINTANTNISAKASVSYVDSQDALKENTANKSTTMTGNATNNTVFLTAKAIYDWAVGLFAPISSPALTGTPTAPTATAGTNTTQIATTAYVMNAVVGGIDLSSYATISYVDTGLSTKAPLASPTFTGTVILPSTTSIGAVTATEIGYVDGVTSSIQTQLNSKVAKSGDTMTGTLNLPTGGLTVGTSQVYVSSSGQLGVNTTSPAHKLDVNGTARLGANNNTDSDASVLLDGGQITIAGAATQSYKSQFEVNSNSITLRSNGYYSGGEQLYDSAKAPATISLFSNNLNSYISLSTKDTNTAGATERMRVDKLGNVGIGTTSPAYRLDVVGSSSTDAVSQIQNTNTAGASGLLAKDDTGTKFLTVGIRNSASTLAATYGSGQEALVRASGSADGLTLSSSSTSGYIRALTGSSGTERMRIDSSGNIGIGTTTPAAKLEVAGNLIGRDTAVANTASNFRLFSGAYSGNPATVIAASSSSTANGLNIGGGSGLGEDATSIAFVTASGVGTLNSGSTRMFINPSGSILFGTTTTPGTTATGSGFAPATNGRSQLLMSSSHSTGSVNMVSFFNTSTAVNTGNISCTQTATTYGTTSDYRLKQDFQDFKGQELLDQIKVYDYEWKNEKTRSYGVIAHELQEVLPHAVIGEKDAVDEEGNIAPQNVDYSKLVPILIKSIQELSVKVKELESKI